MSTFIPPMIFDSPSLLPTTRGVQRRLFRYYGGNPRGQSVLWNGATFTTVVNPTTDQLDAAGGRDGIDFFLGGHVYPLTAAQVVTLTAAGYGANIA